MFLHTFEGGPEKILLHFELDGDALAGADILLASYNIHGWSGDAYVLFRRDGQLFEVFGSHCSCHGLAGQWDPQETSLPALSARADLYARALADDEEEGNDDGCRTEFIAIVRGLYDS